MGKKYTQKWKESEGSGRTQEERALGGQASRWQQIQGDLFSRTNWMGQLNESTTKLTSLSLSLSTYLLYLFLQVSDPVLSVQWTAEHMDKFCYSYFDQTCVLTPSPKKNHTRFDSHQRSLIRQNGKFSSSQIVMNLHIYFGTVQSLILVFKILWWANERCSSKKKKNWSFGLPPQLSIMSHNMEACGLLGFKQHEKNFIVIFIIVMNLHYRFSLPKLSTPAAVMTSLICKRPVLTKTHVF